MYNNVICMTYDVIFFVGIPQIWRGLKEKILVNTPKPYGFKLNYFQFLVNLVKQVEKTLVLKVQSCKIHNKYMIASAQITNTEILAFVAVLVFKLLSF